MRRIVGGIDVEDHLGRHGAACADEEIDQVVIEDLQSLALGGAHLQEDVTLFGGQLGLAAGEGVLEAGQRTAGGQRLLCVGADVGEDLEERVEAQVVVVIVVGIASEQGIDLLGEDGLDGVADEVRGAGVGQ